MYYKAARVLKNTDVAETLFNAVDFEKKRGSVNRVRTNDTYNSHGSPIMISPGLPSIKSPEGYETMPDSSVERLKSALQRDIHETMMDVEDENRLTFIVDVDEESLHGRDASYRQMLDLGKMMIQALDCMGAEELTAQQHEENKAKLKISQFKDDADAIEQAKQL